MTARDQILARIRSAAGKRGATSQSDLDTATAYIAQHAQYARLPSDWPDLAARFKEQCERLASTVDDVPTMNNVPASVRRYLIALNLPLAGVCWMDLAALDWQASGIKMEARPANGSDLLGVTTCLCAIAETGTVLLTTSPGTPNTTSLLPDTHICVVKTARILPGMEDAWQLLRAELHRPPRGVSFISGPSRTGDIEQTIVLGAHGPYRVHIILVREPLDAAADLIKTDWWRSPPQPTA